MIRALHTRTYMIGRSSGKSAAGASAYRSGSSVVAASAYRACERIHEDGRNKTHDYTRKRGVVFSGIFLPAKAPKRFADRSTLWNEVERVENRKNSQFARQWEASIPAEFSADDRLELVSSFVKDYFINFGMIADVAIHDIADRDGGRNVHTHILLTLRRVNEKGFTGNKERTWNDKKLAQLWRTAWADRCNAIYKKMDLPQRIDPRSYEIQNNGLEPTKPIGKRNNEAEKRGFRTAAGDKNRAIIERNKKVMQNILYDVTISQENQVLNAVERETMEAEAMTEAERAKMETDLKTDIRKLKAEIDDLTEYKQLFDEIQAKIAVHEKAGNAKAVKQLEQSRLEAALRLQEEYEGYNDSNFRSILINDRKQLESLEQYLEDLPDIENNPNYRDPSEDRENIIRVDFEREEDRTPEEIEADREIEREKEKER